MEYCKLGCNMNGPEWAFRKLTRTHHQAQSAVFSRVQLKNIGQPVMLFILSDMKSGGKTCTQKHLCDIMHLSPPTVTMSIKSLENQGYVRKRIDKSDQRRNFVEITDAGMEVAEICHACFEDIDNAMYAGFSEDELAAVTGFFSRMAENLVSLRTTLEEE